MSGRDEYTLAGRRIAALSEWIDDANADRNPEALTWHRVAKVGEEAGEVIEAMIGLTAGNPRKGQTHDKAALVEELLDTAVAALGAVEHLMGNAGTSMWLLHDKVRRVADRAGLETVR